MARLFMLTSDDLMCFFMCTILFFFFCYLFFFQAEDGIRYLVRSRGLGDVYKRQGDEAVEGCDYGRRSTLWRG